MGNFSGDRVDSYEKKISVQQAFRMYQSGKLVFPVTPSVGRAKKIERVSETVEVILRGIALQVVYMSERQDGSLLVLDSDDRLQHFMGFLEGVYPVLRLEFFTELDGYKLEQMEQKFPRWTSLVYDYKISFQIMEYTTPRYMHMQVGNYIERWNFTREQGVRNGLYGKELEEFLSSCEKELGRASGFLSRQILNRQYMVLRILMYRFVFEGEIRGRYEESMGLQQLLDRAVECLRIKDRLWERENGDDLRLATREIVSWGRRVDFDLAREKGKEWQAKILGYLYNVVWICKKRIVLCSGGWSRLGLMNGFGGYPWRKGEFCQYPKALW